MLRILLPLFLMVSLGACTFTGLILSQADRFILWYLDDYLDLNGSQTLKAKQYLNAYWFRVRCDHSQRFQRELNGLATRIQSGASESLADDIERFFTTWKIRVLRPMLPFASEFLSTITLDQWKNFREETTEKMSSLKERIRMPEQEYLESRDETVRDRLEEYYGEVDDKTFSVVRPWLISPQSQLRQWLVFRENRLDTVMTFFNQKQGKKRIYKQLDQWLTEPDSLLDPGLRLKAAALRARWYQNIAEMNQRMPEANRKKFSEYLRSFARDVADSRPAATDCQAAGLNQGGQN